MRLTMVAKKGISYQRKFHIYRMELLFFYTKIGVAFEKCKTCRGASIGIKRSIFVDPIPLKVHKIEIFIASIMKFVIFLC
jgi:hypothetical protein